MYQGNILVEYNMIRFVGLFVIQKNK